MASRNSRILRRHTGRMYRRLEGRRSAYYRFTYQSLQLLAGWLACWSLHDVEATEDRRSLGRAFACCVLCVQFDADQNMEVRKYP